METVFSSKNETKKSVVCTIMGLCVCFLCFFRDHSLYGSQNGQMHVHYFWWKHDDDQLYLTCMCGIEIWTKKQQHKWIHENKSHTWLSFVEGSWVRLQKCQEQSNTSPNMQRLAYRVHYRLWPSAICVNEFKCEYQVVANEMLWIYIFTFECSLFRSWPWPWSRILLVAIPLIMAGAVVTTIRITRQLEQSCLIFTSSCDKKRTFSFGICCISVLSIYCRCVPIYWWSTFPFPTVYV